MLYRVKMNKKTYRQVQSVVSVFIGFVVSISVIRDTYQLAMVGMALGMITLWVAGRQLEEVVNDERTAVIQQKASTMTLSILTVVLAFAGIASVELSFRGYEAIRDYGYFMAYLAMGIMSLNGVFTWHYGKQLGD